MPLNHLLASLKDFTGAVFLHWYVWIAGIALVIDQLWEHFSENPISVWLRHLLDKWPRGKEWIYTHCPPEKRRRQTLICVGIFGFFIAAFQAYDDVRSKLIDMQMTQTSRKIQLSRKMADDLVIRIKAAGPDFVNQFTGDNFISIAFTCGSGAQQFAEDFSQILESAGVRASRLVFCTANTEIETSGLYMTVPDPENLTYTAKEVFRIIRDSLIPIAPHPRKDSELMPQSIGFIYAGE